MKREPVRHRRRHHLLAEALFAGAAAFGIFEPSPAQVAAVVAIITAGRSVLGPRQVTPV